MDGRSFDNVVRQLGAGRSRRSVLRGLVGGGAILIGARTQGALGAKPAKVAICHWNEDLGAYELISVSSNAVPAHQRHGDLIDPDFLDPRTCGGCNTACLSPINGYATCDTDGCGFVCNDGYEPDSSGSCVPTVCIPDCSAGICGGSDGCDGVCQSGSCAGGLTCTDGACVPTVCIPDCSAGICGGSDGCDGVCGCADGFTCINGGCFSGCQGGCPSCPGCGCFNTVSDGRHCLDSSVTISPCASDTDCPAGSICTAFFSTNPQLPYLCTQPCCL